MTIETPHNHSDKLSVGSDSEATCHNGSEMPDRQALDAQIGGIAFSGTMQAPCYIRRNGILFEVRGVYNAQRTSAEQRADEIVGIIKSGPHSDRFNEAVDRAVRPAIIKNLGG